MQSIDSAVVGRMGDAACDMRPIAGYTHNFYRYPARFSPQFAATAIDCFSKPGDIVLDPYMGGGTTVLEGLVAGRRTIGSDVNQLSIFVAQTKMTTLQECDEHLVLQWATDATQKLKCTDSESIPGWSHRNMRLTETRWLRKTLSLLIASIGLTFQTEASRRFARCVLLNVGQWALNGRKRIPTVSEFRNRVVSTTIEMLAGMVALRETIANSPRSVFPPVLRENDAEAIDHDPAISAMDPVDLVVTSPPYPGIHMLYHRWQVDGRKETDAPYWIAGCNDGAGVTFYNFADRRRQAEERYFLKAKRSFSAIRRVMRPGGVLVQLIAFGSPERQLDRYLEMLEQSGFQEARHDTEDRLWRNVPGRRWHAQSKGSTSSAREVLLLHQAI